MAYENHHGTQGFTMLDHIPGEDMLTISSHDGRNYDLAPFAAYVPQEKSEVVHVRDHTMAPLTNHTPVTIDRTQGQINTASQAANLWKTHDYGPDMRTRILHENVKPRDYSSITARSNIPMVGVPQHQYLNTDRQAQYHLRVLNENVKPRDYSDITARANIPMVGVPQQQYLHTDRQAQYHLRVLHENVKPQDYSDITARSNIPMVGVPQHQYLNTDKGDKYYLHQDHEIPLHQIHNATNLYTVGQKGYGENTHVLTGVRELEMPTHHGGTITIQPRPRKEIDLVMAEGQGADRKYMEVPMKMTNPVFMQPSIMHHTTPQVEYANDVHLGLDRDHYAALNPRATSMYDTYHDHQTHDTDFDVIEPSSW